MKKFAWLTTMLVAVVSVSASGQVVVTPYEGYEWIHEYANPFAGGVSYVWDETKWSNVSDRPVTLLTSLRHSRNVNCRIVSTYADWKPGDTVELTLTMPQTKIGTVITSQMIWSDTYNDPIHNTYPMSYDLRLGGGGAGTDWGNIDPVMSGDGTRGTYAIQVQTLDRVGAYDSIRLDLNSVKLNNDKNEGFVDFNNVIVLPDRLEQIKATASTSSGGVASSLTGNTAGSWWIPTTFPGTVTFAFPDLEPGEKQQIDAILIWSMDNASAAFTLKDGDGTPLVDISMPVGGGPGYILPLQFDQSLHTDKIILDLASGGLFQVMFLTKLPEIPEPATMSLLALGGLALLRRRK